jgi:hypothetical protein
MVCLFFPVLVSHRTNFEPWIRVSLQVARTAKKAPATTATATHMQAAPPSQKAAAEAAVLSAAASEPPQPSFLYTAAPPAGPVPYVWGPWPPTAGYEHAAGSPPATSLPPCAWYYPAAVVADPTGWTAEEDTDDDPCSLTLAIDVVDKRTAPIAIGSSRATEAGQKQVDTERDKAAAAAEARKKMKELTKLKHVHAAARPGGEQW